MSVANGNAVQDEREMLDHVTKFLRDEGIEVYDCPVQIEWVPTQDEHGKRMYTLKLADPDGEAQETFSPEELRDPSSIRFELLRVWGKMLQAGTDKMIRQMREARERGAENGSESN